MIIFGIKYILHDLLIPDNVITYITECECVVLKYVLLKIQSLLNKANIEIEIFFDWIVILRVETDVAAKKKRPHFQVL